MKKLFLLLSLSLVLLSTKAQIKIAFFDDVPTLHKEVILAQICNTIPLFFNDYVAQVVIVDVPAAYCAFNKKYDVNKFIDPMLVSKKLTIGITYRPLVVGCAGQEVLGYSYETAGVVSMYDLGTTERLMKIILHELGHLYGLQHCTTLHCLMEAGGDPDTLGEIDREKSFCISCKIKLKLFIKW